MKKKKEKKRKEEASLVAGEPTIPSLLPSTEPLNGRLMGLSQCRTDLAKHAIGTQDLVQCNPLTRRGCPFSLIHVETLPCRASASVEFQTEGWRHGWGGYIAIEVCQGGGCTFRYDYRQIISKLANNLKYTTYGI